MRSDFAYFDRAAGLSNHFLFVLVLGFARVQYTGNVENFGSKRKMEPPSSKSTHPPSIHQSDLDDEDDNVKQLDHCAILYLALQDCLVNTNRNWKSCQPEVRALKACHEKKKIVQKEDSAHN